MRKIFAAVAGISMLGFAAGASASELPTAEQTDEPILLTSVEMDGVTAGGLVLPGINVQVATQTANVLNVGKFNKTRIKQNITQVNAPFGL